MKSQILLVSLLLSSSSYGETITVTCKGEGPSLSLAWKDADRECMSSAILRLEAELSSISTAIESEKDTHYHSEVTRSGFYEGLICKPENEKVTETSDKVLVQITCRFDLARVKRLSKPQVQDKLSAPDRRIISLATSPYCKDILVRGLTSRVIPCLSNPVRLVLKNTDEAITVRAPKYLPRTVQKGDLGDSATIILDPIR